MTDELKKAVKLVATELGLNALGAAASWLRLDAAEKAKDSQEIEMARAQSKHRTLYLGHMILDLIYQAEEGEDWVTREFKKLKEAHKDEY